MGRDFYQIAKEIDEISNQENPTDHQINKLFGYITEEKFARYFFFQI